MDKYTFQFAEPRGKAAIEAYGRVTINFIRGFKESPYYRDIVSGFLHALLESGELSEASMKHLESAVNDRINALLEEERAKDRDRNKGRRPVYELKDEGDDDYEEEEPEMTEEEKQRLAKERAEQELREKKRREELERMKAENEAILRERARKVDTSRLNDQLVLNSSAAVSTKGGKPGKGGAAAKKQYTEEEVNQLEREVALMMKERERLQTVLHTSEADLPSALEEAKKSLAEVQAELAVRGKAAPVPKNMQPKQLNVRFTELQQKLTKVSTDRNRFSLQLLAAPSEERSAILEVLRQRDEIQVELDKHNQ